MKKIIIIFIMLLLLALVGCAVEKDNDEKAKESEPISVNDNKIDKDIAFRMAINTQYECEYTICKEVNMIVEDGSVRTGCLDLNCRQVCVQAGKEFKNIYIKEYPSKNIGLTDEEYVKELLENHSDLQKIIDCEESCKDKVVPPCYNYDCVRVCVAPALVENANYRNVLSKLRRG